MDGSSTSCGKSRRETIYEILGNPFKGLAFRSFLMCFFCWELEIASDRVRGSCRVLSVYQSSSQWCLNDGSKFRTDSINDLTLNRRDSGTSNVSNMNITTVCSTGTFRGPRDGSCMIRIIKKLIIVSIILLGRGHFIKKKSFFFVIEKGFYLWCGWTSYTITDVKKSFWQIENKNDKIGLKILLLITRKIF